MPYDIYKKLMACANSADWSMGNKNSNKKTSLYADKIGEERQHLKENTETTNI